MAVAWCLKHFTSAGRQVRPLMMELPNYHWPTVRGVAIGLLQRVVIFLKRVGGIILGLTIVLWFLASFPAPPAGATGAAIEYSLAGTLGPRAGGGLRAHRLQLADLHRAGTRHGRA